jgi:hypothetical protein
MSSRPLEDERAQPHIGASIGISWLTPLMVIAGAWATRDLWRQPDWLLWLALAVLLAAMWSLVWSIITGVRWAALLSGWRAWSQGAPLPALPYTQPGSDAAYLALRLGHLRSWLSNDVWPYYGSALLFCALAVIITAALAAVMGTAAVLLSLASVGLAQIAALACQGNGKPNAFMTGAATVGLPVLLGYATFKGPTLQAWVLSLASTVIFVDVHNKLPGRDLGLAAAALTAAILRWPASAFALTIIWAARSTLKLGGRGYLWLALAVFCLAITAG